MITNFQQDGKQFIQLQFPLGILDVQIAREINSNHKSYVINEQLFKSNKPQSTTYGKMIASVEVNDFVSEMGDIFKILKEHHLELFRQQKLSEENLQNFSVVFYNALAYLCADHIERHKRLITTDMDGYLDSVMLFFNSTFQAAQQSNIPEHLGKHIRDSYEYNLTNLFIEFIYVPQPLPDGRWKLIKLRDDDKNI